MLEFMGDLAKDTLILAAMLIVRIGLPVLIVVELGRLVERWLGAPEGIMEERFEVAAPVNEQVSHNHAANDA